MAQKMPVVGSVISSPEFAYGYHDFDNEDGTPNPIIVIDGETQSHIVSESYSEEERVAAALKGKKLPKWHEIDYGAYDKSRGMAKFVVERAEMEGGSTGGGMSGHDDYPDELHVTARKLHPNGKYNPEGELIDFYYPHGCHTNSVNHLTFYSQMKRVFV